MQRESGSVPGHSGWPLSKSLAGALLLLVSTTAQAREVAISCSGTTTTNNRNHANQFPAQSIASTATWFIDTERRTADYKLYGNRVAGKAVELAAGQLLVCREVCGSETSQGTDREGSYTEEKIFDRVAIDVGSGRTSFVTRQVRRFPDGTFFDMSATFDGQCDTNALAQAASELGGDSMAAAGAAEGSPSDVASSAGDASSAQGGADAEADAQRVEDERRRAEAERLAAQERRAADEQRAAEARLREAEQREAEMKKRLEEQEKRLAELQRKEEEAKRKAEEASRPVEFKEGIVLCQMGSNENANARCHGPLQTITSAIRGLDDAYTRAQIGMACGSDRNLRDIGMVSGMRAFGCGFGIHPDPAMASFPGNNDVPARLAIYVADRGVFRCPRSVEAYCTNR